MLLLLFLLYSTWNMFVVRCIVQSMSARYSFHSGWSLTRSLSHYLALTIQILLLENLKTIETEVKFQIKIKKKTSRKYQPTYQYFECRESACNLRAKLEFLFLFILTVRDVSQQSYSFLLGWSCCCVEFPNCIEWTNLFKISKVLQKKLNNHKTEKLINNN